MGGRLRLESVAGLVWNTQTAAQLVPTADGSYLMGSLRNPAGFNNVIGFRPSQGRVPSPSAESDLY
jgi:amidase